MEPRAMSRLKVCSRVLETGTGIKYTCGAVPGLETRSVVDVTRVNGILFDSKGGSPSTEFGGAVKFKVSFGEGNQRYSALERKVRSFPAFPTSRAARATRQRT